eukprot:TRINITY_DN1977_c0_g1_i4.p1 TRINITY_DN1977_c0_g1~~TRINITY_DN1977_c0_g1_i4.p1  ORF type:complete len:304 (-),score=59.89 TRINITY_DN1977_c0_g1_i4:55-966(-)
MKIGNLLTCSAMMLRSIDFKINQTNQVDPLNLCLTLKPGQSVTKIGVIKLAKLLSDLGNPLQLLDVLDLRDWKRHPLKVKKAYDEIIKRQNESLFLVCFERDDGKGCDQYCYLTEWILPSAKWENEMWWTTEKIDQITIKCADPTMNETWNNTVDVKLSRVKGRVSYDMLEIRQFGIDPAYQRVMTTTNQIRNVAQMIDQLLPGGNVTEKTSLGYILWNDYTYKSQRLSWDRTKDPSEASLALVTKIARNETVNPTPEATSFTLVENGKPEQPCPYTMKSDITAKKLSKSSVKNNLCSTLGGQ